jgi:hypothetical protein
MKITRQKKQVDLKQYLGDFGVYLPRTHNASAQQPRLSWVLKSFVFVTGNVSAEFCINTTATHQQAGYLSLTFPMPGTQYEACWKNKKQIDLCITTIVDLFMKAVSGMGAIRIACKAI